MMILQQRRFARGVRLAAIRRHAIIKPALPLCAIARKAGAPRRVGRVAEGGGLLNRYRVKSSIGGSNPPLSATQSWL